MHDGKQPQHTFVIVPKTVVGINTSKSRNGKTKDKQTNCPQ